MQRKFLTVGLFLLLNSAKAQRTLSYTSIETYFNNGLELFEKKAYTSARKEFYKYIQAEELKANPDRFGLGTAGYYEALSGLKSGALDAEAGVGRFVIKYPEHPKALTIYGDLGDNYFVKQEYELARKFYEKGLMGRSQGVQTYRISYQLGLTNYLLGDAGQALGYFNQLKNTPSEFSIDASYFAGVINFKNQNYEEALTDFYKVENSSDYKDEAPTWISQILYRQKRYDELLVYTESIINNPKGRNIEDLTLLAAEVSFFQEKYNKAAAYYQKYRGFRKNPTSSQLAFRQGYSLFKTEKYQEAIEILKLAATENSLIGQQSAYYIGISALKATNLDAALAAFSTAKNLSFDKDIREESNFNSIKIMVELNNSQQAINALKAYLREFPNGKYQDESNELLSEILYETSNYSTAISYIESLGRRTSKINQAYQKLAFNQAVLLYQKGQYDVAMLNFDKSLSQPLNKDLAYQARYWKTESAFQKGETTHLLADYKALARENNTILSRKSLYNAAYLQFNARDFSEAENLFRQFANTESKNTVLKSYEEDAYLRIADCRLAAKDFRESLKFYDFSYKNHEYDREYALYQKGVCLKYLDRDAEAKQVFDQFESNFSKSRYIAEVLFQKGILEMDKANYKMAVEIFTDLMRRKPDSKLMPEALLKRALANANLQKYEASILDYKLILDKYGSSPIAEEALLGLKEALNATNRSEEFYDAATDYQKDNPNSESVQGLQFSAAKDFFFAEKYDKAIEALKKYEKNYPNTSYFPELQYLIGESYYILNKKSTALTYYQKVQDQGSSPYLVKSALRGGQIYLDEQHFQDALRSFMVATGSAEIHREIVVALEGEMKAYYGLGDYTKCAEVADKILSQNTEVVIGAVNRAQLFKGKAYLGKKNYSEAKTAFQKTISLGHDNSAAEAKYWIAYVLYQQGQYDNSIKELQELGAIYSEFEYWYEKAFLLIADNYISKKDNFMAKATLTSIIENSDNKITVDAAKEKLNSLK